MRQPLIHGLIWAMALIALAEVHGYTLGPDRRITVQYGASWEASVATVGSTVHVVWLDYGDGSDGEIHYLRSRNLGTTWEPTRRLTDNAHEDSEPWMVVRGEGVYVAWSAQRPEYGSATEIHFVRSLDQGDTWSAEGRVSWNTGESNRPRMSMGQGGDLHLSWFDDSNGIPQSFYSRSTDGGNSWSASSTIGRSFENVDTEFAWTLEGPTGEILAFVRDSRMGYPAGGNPPYEIFRMRSVDQGASWIFPALPLTHTRPTEWSNAYDHGVLLDSTGKLHITWWEDGAGSNAYHRSSTDGGYTWSTPMQLSAFPGSHPPHNGWGWSYPGLVERVPGELWCILASHWVLGGQNPGRRGDLFLVGSTDGGASWGTPTQITQSGRARNPRLARASQDELLVIWQDDRDDQPPADPTYGDELYMKKILFGVAEDHHPRVIVGGWWLSALSEQGGGELQLALKVEDPDGLQDIQRVELAWEGLPLGIELDPLPSGQDFGLGDGTYGLVVPVDPGVAAEGLHAIEIEVEDSQGNLARWPYLEIRSIAGTVPYLAWSLLPSVPSPVSWHAPDIQVAGYWDTLLHEEDGGNLTITARVIDVDGDWDLQRVELYWDGIGTGILLNDEGAAGGVGDEVPGDDYFTWKTTIAPGLLSGIAGNYPFTIVAADSSGRRSEWPFLAVRP